MTDDLGDDVVGSLLGKLLADLVARLVDYIKKIDHELRVSSFVVARSIV